MRYYIMFGITLFLTLFIIFYKPDLGVYKDKVTIEYSFKEEGYKWSYEIDGNALKLNNESLNKWTFKVNKNGPSNITFKYTNEEGNELYRIEYKFKVFGKRIFWKEGIGHGLIDYPNPY